MSIQTTRRIGRSEAIQLFKRKLDVSLTNEELAEELEETFYNYIVVDDEVLDKEESGD